MRRAIIATVSLSVAAIVSLSMFNAARADNVGPNLPTNATSSGTGKLWDNAGNITANDGAYASVYGIGAGAGSGLSQSQPLIGTGFGFSIPFDSTINGIEATANGSTSASCTSKIISLVKNGSTNVGSTKTTSYGATPTTVTYGGPADLWGTTWTATELNASTFGVKHQIAKASPNFVFTCQGGVDYVSVKVYYTLGISSGTQMMIASDF